jgi:hypothetical protein
LNRLASELSHTVARGFLDELTHTMTPADREEFIQGLRNALFESSRELSKGVVAGFSDALAQDRESRGVGPEDTLTAQMNKLLKRGSRLTSAFAVGLVLALLALVAWIMTLHARHRRERERWQQAIGELRGHHEDLASRERLVRMLKEVLSDPEARQMLADELQSRQPPPPPH